MKARKFFPPAEATGEKLSNKGCRGRNWLTVNGEVCLSRGHYHGKGAGTITPMDVMVDLAEATVSLGVREMCCRLNAGAGGFAKAAQNLRLVGQVPMSGEKLRQVVEREGRLVQEASESGALTVPWRAGDCQVEVGQSGRGQETEKSGKLTETGNGGKSESAGKSEALIKSGKPGGSGIPGLSDKSESSGKSVNPGVSEKIVETVSRVYVSADGFMVPLVTETEKAKRRQQVRERRRKLGKKVRGSSSPRRKGADQRYKEFKAVTFYDQMMEHRLVSVTRRDCQALGRIMRRDAGRIEFYDAKERIGTIDGGPWARNQVQRRLRVTALGLDFFHLSQNVHQGRKVIFGEHDPTGFTVADQWLHAVKHQGYEALWELLASRFKTLRSPVKRAALTRLINYVSDRRDMIDYPRFLANGWRIGSGPMESQCRVLPRRVKGPGKRWDGDNAEHVMALESLEQSHMWSNYWNWALSGPS